MIDTTKTIDHLYSALCIEGRQLSLSKEGIGWICTNCDRMEFVSAALSLLEQIKELRP